MTATVYYDSVNELAILTTTFTNSAGTPTDPTAVTLVVTEPSGASVTHSWGGAAPADITRVSAGKFTVAIPASPSAAGVDGLWGGVWNATGLVTAVLPVTWRVLPLGMSQVAYIGAEEFKDRMGITDSSEDYAIQTSILASAGWINEYCGRHFYRVTETRTFQPHDIWVLDVDDIVPGAPITVNVDQDGDGIYEQAWIQGTDYQLMLGPGRYNVNTTGVIKPYQRLQVIQSGKWLPFTWPFTPLNRVQIQTTWGWTGVPWQVAEANRILATDEFKMKDAPFGVAGVSDLGVVRIQSNPWLVENLRPFINARRKVGV